MKNYHGQDLASADWLKTHFQAKSAQRVAQILQLPIQEGDKVLDVCSGPGIFAKYFLTQVGERGHVHCLDHDPINIDNAEIQLSNSCLSNWSTQCGDMSEAISLASDFDAIVIFNSLCYLANPEDLISKIAEKMKSGSKIIIKDFDLSFIKLHGVCSQKWEELIHLAMSNNFHDNPLSYNNFSGRGVHFLHKAYPFSKHHNGLWVQHLGHPYTESSRTYIWENVRTLLDQSKIHENESLYDYFHEEFNVASGCFYEKEESLFIETEFLSVLTK